MANLGAVLLVPAFHVSGASSNPSLRHIWSTGIKHIYVSTLHSVFQLRRLSNVYTRILLC